jgi:hypothetical protein
MDDHGGARARRDLTLFYLDTGSQFRRPREAMSKFFRVKTDGARGLQSPQD